MSFSDAVKAFLTRLRYWWSGETEAPEPAPLVPVAEPDPVGTRGPLGGNALFLVEGDQAVLVVDRALGDIPAWAEWDVSLDRLSVAQAAGAVAHLDALIPRSELEKVKLAKRLLLVSHVGGSRVTHYLPFVIRE